MARGCAITPINAAGKKTTCPPGGGCTPRPERLRLSRHVSGRPCAISTSPAQSLGPKRLAFSFFSLTCPRCGACTVRTADSGYPPAYLLVGEDDPPTHISRSASAFALRQLPKFARSLPRWLCSIVAGEAASPYHVANWMVHSQTLDHGTGLVRNSTRTLHGPNRSRDMSACRCENNRQVKHSPPMRLS